MSKILNSFKMKEDAPRLVLLGNSNVGKSTIARFFLSNKSNTAGSIGKKAGSTVALRLYRDRNRPYQIVDLPGFGAMTRTSKELKEKIHDAIVNYVETDKKNIFLAFVVMNSIRIHDELEKWYYNNEDTIPLSFEFVTWLNELEIPSIVLLNKMDRLKKRELNLIIKEVKDVFNDLEVNVGDIGDDYGLLEIRPISAKLKKNIKELPDIVSEYFSKKFPQKNNSPAI